MFEGKRQTIRLGSRLAALFATGACSASSVPKRLDILAGRFQHILSSTKVPSWPADTWCTLLKISAQIDLSQPGAIYAIQGNAKAIGESRLNFARDSLSPAQHILLMVIAEQYLSQHEAVEADLVEAFLEALGHTVAPAKP